MSKSSKMLLLLIVMLVALTGAFALSACNKKNNNNSNDTNPDTTENPDIPTIVGMFASDVSEFVLPDDYTLSSIDLNADNVLSFAKAISVNLAGKTLNLNGATINISSLENGIVSFVNGTIKNGTLNISIPNGDIVLDGATIDEDVTYSFEAADETIRFNNARITGKGTILSDSNVEIKYSTVSEITLAGNGTLTAGDGAEMGSITVGENSTGAKVNISQKATANAVVLKAASKIDVAGSIASVTVAETAKDTAGEVSVNIASTAKVSKVDLQAAANVDVAGEVEAVTVAETAKQDAKQINVTIASEATVTKVEIKSAANVEVSGKVEAVTVAETARAADNKTVSVNIKSGAEVAKVDLKATASVEVSGTVSNVVVQDSAAGSTVSATATAVVTTLAINAEDITVDSDADTTIAVFVADTIANVNVSDTIEAVTRTADEMSEMIKHTHIFVVTSRIEPTCTEKGKASYICEEDGETKEVEIPALGHDYEYSIIKMPTADEPGIGKYICKRCGDEKEVEIKVDVSIRDEIMSAIAAILEDGTYTLTFEGALPELGNKYKPDTSGTGSSRNSTVDNAKAKLVLTIDIKDRIPTGTAILDVDYDEKIRTITYENGVVMTDETTYKKGQHKTVLGFFNDKEIMLELDGDQAEIFSVKSLVRQILSGIVPYSEEISAISDIYARLDEVESWFEDIAPDTDAAPADDAEDTAAFDDIAKALIAIAFASETADDGSITYTFDEASIEAFFAKTPAGIIDELTAEGTYARIKDYAAGIADKKVSDVVNDVLDALENSGSELTLNDIYDLIKEAAAQVMPEEEFEDIDIDELIEKYSDLTVAEALSLIAFNDEPQQAEPQQAVVAEVQAPALDDGADVEVDVAVDAAPDGAVEDDADEIEIDEEAVAQIKALLNGYVETMDEYANKPLSEIMATFDIPYADILNEIKKMTAAGSNLTLTFDAEGSLSAYGINLLSVEDQEDYFVKINKSASDAIPQIDVNVEVLKAKLDSADGNTAFSAAFAGLTATFDAVKDAEDVYTVDIVVAPEQIVADDQPAAAPVEPIFSANLTMDGEDITLTAAHLGFTLSYSEIKSDDGYTVEILVAPEQVADDAQVAAPVEPIFSANLTVAGDDVTLTAAHLGFTLNYSDINSENGRAVEIVVAPEQLVADDAQVAAPVEPIFSANLTVAGDDVTLTAAHLGYTLEYSQITSDNGCSVEIVVAPKQVADDAPVEPLFSATINIADSMIAFDAEFEDNIFTGKIGKDAAGADTGYGFDVIVSEKQAAEGNAAIGADGQVAAPAGQVVTEVARYTATVNCTKNEDGTFAAFDTTGSFGPVNYKLNFVPTGTLNADALALAEKYAFIHEMQPEADYYGHHYVMTYSASEDGEYYEITETYIDDFEEKSISKVYTISAYEGLPFATISVEADCEDWVQVYVYAKCDNVSVTESGEDYVNEYTKPDSARFAFYYNRKTGEYASTSQHDYEVSCEFYNGEDCEDGVIVTKTCSVCDYTYDYETYGHEYDSEKIFINTQCSGDDKYENTYIEKETCTLCGDTHMYFEEGGVHNFEDIVDGEDITRGTDAFEAISDEAEGFYSGAYYVRKCTQCHLTISCYSWYTSVDGECLSHYRTVVDYAGNDEYDFAPAHYVIDDEPYEGHDCSDQEFQPTDAEIDEILSAVRETIGYIYDLGNFIDRSNIVSTEGYGYICMGCGKKISAEYQIEATNGNAVHYNKSVESDYTDFSVYISDQSNIVRNLSRYYEYVPELRGMEFTEGYATINANNVNITLSNTSNYNYVNISAYYYSANYGINIELNDRANCTAKTITVAVVEGMDPMVDTNVRENHDMQYFEGYSVNCAQYGYKYGERCVNCGKEEYVENYKEHKWIYDYDEIDAEARCEICGCYLNVVISLDHDVVLTDDVAFAAEGVLLDLNGYNLDLNGHNLAIYSYNGAALTVTDNTFESIDEDDLSENGIINSDPENESTLLLLANGDIYIGSIQINVKYVVSDTADIYDYANYFALDDDNTANATIIDLLDQIR